MTEQQQVEEQVEEAKPAPKRARRGDEQAYEDSWYQVLRRLAPGDDEA